LKNYFHILILMPIHNWIRKYYSLANFEAHNIFNEVEVTVAQKSDQGTIPKTGCFRFRMCFFGSFLHNQKRTIDLLCLPKLHYSKPRATIFILLLSFCSLIVNAQKENAAIRKGNRYYKEQKFDESQKQYQQALQQSPENAAANYNLGNAQFRANSFEDAVKSYDATLAHADDKNVKEKSFYNKGVASIKQKKPEESIAAWKDALKLNPADDEARDNLQKALLEQKNKQQQQKDKDKKEDKKQDDKKQDNKDQQKQDQKQQQPQQQKSRLSKQQVEQLLKALQQKEKDVQDKMNQNKVKSLSQPDKDW